MTVFVRGAAARRATPSLIVRSILGSNALRPRGAKATGAPRIHGGTDLDNSRGHKARAVGTVRAHDGGGWPRNRNGGRDCAMKGLRASGPRSSAGRAADF